MSLSGQGIPVDLVMLTNDKERAALLKHLSIHERYEVTRSREVPIARLTATRGHRSSPVPPAQDCAYRSRVATERILMVEKKEASTSEGIRMISEPSDEVSEKSEEAVTVGTLTIRYVNDIPEITLNSGTAIPGEIIVVDSQGNPVALYTGSALPNGPATRGANHAHGHFLPAGHTAVVPAAVPVAPVLLSDRALKRDVVGVVWA